MSFCIVSIILQMSITTDELYKRVGQNTSGAEEVDKINYMEKTLRNKPIILLGDEAYISDATYLIERISTGIMDKK